MGTRRHIFCTEIKIINSGSHDKSQKLKQTKCFFFHFWMIRLTKTPILPNCQVQNSFFWYIHFNLQILKIIHLVCLTVWDISRDPGFRTPISVHKMWPFVKSLIGEKLNANCWIISPHYALPPVATMQKTNALYQVFYKCQWILNVQWKYSFYHENA